MELKKGFTDFLAEAKDAQKAKENADMTKNDASHGEKSTTLDPKVKGDGNTYEGDKADNLDPSINEDAQKAKENADMKKNDASHGEKATIVKEGDEKGKVLHGEKECDDEKEKTELDESLNEASSTDFFQKKFTADIVSKFFSACSHEEGTDMAAPPLVKYVGKKGDKFIFQYPVYDANEAEWYISEMYFTFDYPTVPIEEGFKNRDDAFKKCKGTKI